MKVKLTKNVTLIQVVLLCFSISNCVFEVRFAAFVAWFRLFRSLHAANCNG